MSCASRISFSSLFDCIPVFAFFGLLTLVPLQPLAIAGNTVGFTLEQVLSLTMESNPALHAVSAGARAIEADAVTARSRPNPELSVDAGRGKTREGSSTAAEYGLELSQTIENFSKRTSRVEAAVTRGTAARFETDSFASNLLGEARTAFFAVLLARKRAELLHAQADAAREIVSLIRSRVDAGEGAAIETVRGEVERIRIERRAASADTDLSVARDRLNGLTGGRLSPVFELSGQLEPNSPLPEFESLRRIATSKNPGILVAEARLNAAEADLFAARREWFPDLIVGAFASREIDREATGLRAGLSIPLWNRNRGPIARSTAERDQAASGLESARLDAETHLRAIYQRATFARDQSRLFDSDLLPRSAEVLDVARMAYEQGETSLLELIDARRVYLDASEEGYEAYFEFRERESELLALTGALAPSGEPPAADGPGGASTND